jgi:hypothetical protein
MPRRYLVVRTDKEKQKFLMRELEEGRLRQGWGYDPCQDLRLLTKKMARGGKLNDDEQDARRNRRLLDTEPDGIKPGDMLVLPNLPEDGWWVLARVDGPYSFSISGESSGAGRDYGHVVPVKVIRDGSGNIAKVDPDNEHVDARLRATMRNPGRMWSVDALGDKVDGLLAAIGAGVDATRPQPEAQKVQGVFDSIRSAAWRSIVSRYRGAEFEKLVHELLKRVYVNGKVEHWGGPAEHGADLIVFTRDALGLEYKVAVQVKLHEGTHDDLTALEQIVEARKVHRVDAGVVVTTAEGTSKAFEQRRAELEDTLGIDVRVIARDEFVELVLAHLGHRTL